MSAQLPALLQAATALSGKAGGGQQSVSLEAVLRARLDETYSLTNDAPGDDSGAQDLDGLRLATAARALELLTRIQPHVEDEDQAPDAPPLLGTRDNVVIQTLAALACNWGTNALLASLYSRWPSAMPSSSRVVDLTDSAIHLRRLVTLTSDLLNLSCPFDRDDVKVKYTRITAEFATKLLSDVLRAGCTLGWADCIDEQSRAAIQAQTVKIVGILPPSRVIAALGSLLATPAPTKQDDPPPIPPHARKAVSGLLSRQVLRENGVQGLCTAMLGDEAEQDDAPYDRLEQISKILSAVPAGMKFSTYFEQVIPRLFSFLKPEQDAQVSPAHKRAAAFTLSRFLASDFRHVRISKAIILRTLHLPLLSTATATTTQSPHDPHAALYLLIALVSRMDPSPPLLSTLLSPIVPSLVTLLEHFHQTRTTDPDLRESVRGMLLAWGRVMPLDEATERLWAVVLGAGAAWEGSGETLRPVELSQDDTLPSPETLLGPGDVEGDALDANVFMLRPDPAQFVRLLRDIGREDVAGALFVRALEAYQSTQQDNASSTTLELGDIDPRRPLLYLQLVLQMQSRMPTALEALAKTPDRLLTFVRSALEQHVAALDAKRLLETRARAGNMGLEALRIVDEEEDIEEDADSDDEDSDAEGVPVEHGTALVEVALNLLLSLLELHESLLPTETSGLQSLPPLLARLAEDRSNAAVRRAAREAMFTIRARNAASSLLPNQPSSSAKPTAVDDAQETYQRGLKLLQDPLLPVRASGLSLLRSPVVLRERALLPSVLDAFLRAVQDGESFVYLNAVQGLVAVSLVGGTEEQDVLARLVRAYAHGADGGKLEVEELEKRLRVGEALGQVVKHLHDALAVHVDRLVPPLFALIRTRTAPTVLRASAIGILAQCTDSAGAAVAPYTMDLCSAMLDLLQTETETQVVAQAHSQSKTLDDDPTSTHAKHPPLRRAAAHFLSLLVRTQIAQAYEGLAVRVDDELLKRGRVVLGYVAATDADGVVRAMCREAGEMIEQLFRARLGVE
ncbi:hypothetical protein EXIGLDRAFT_716206 [Exidia glandulosa HHB12029]|uniref:RNA polymerase II assembly factor Rtp1 C-terminal domain-containing protein n=1 Tax=Exidia glandulosa HHB12029 TaxID=1314781 RepID=A0A165QXL1_EXIGL|nr:hypothetical protein EXIGLDRAFT_716206 [Exidia glandulosa HHB12029]